MEQATLDDYFALYAKFPQRFSPDQVGFVDPSKSGYRCGGCQHYYLNPAHRHCVCEIMEYRQYGNVPPSGACRFWTVDGQNFPVLSVL
jgi:hypothetical protein